MSYQVTFTETNNPLKPPITVEDLTINTQTAVTFVGKNYSGYGPLIAKNFLHLLENFASPTGPSNPVQGQLWFDNTDGTSQLKVNLDGTSNGWVSAGGIKKAASPPSANSSIQGDLWVDTINQQLSLFTGSNWLLVGPSFSQGSQTGPKLEQIIDTSNIAHTVQTIYVENQRVMIISNQTFTPKSSQPGYTTINKGVNLYTPLAGESYKFNGLATQANSLLDTAGVAVPVANLLRSDQPSTTNYALNIRSASGITVGSDTGGLSLYTESATNAATFYAKSGNSINFNVNINGDATTVLHLDPSGFVGLGKNKVNPAVALDIEGDVLTTGTVNIGSTAYNSLQTGGGILVNGPAEVKSLKVNGSTMVAGHIIPLINNTSDLGSDPNTDGVAFANIYATNFFGNFSGTFEGGIKGSVSGSATKLASSTKFAMVGDIVNSVEDSTDFDGQNQTLTFNTEITSTAITRQTEITQALGTDEILLFRPNELGLKKSTISTLTSSFPTVPIGAIFTVAGITSKVPAGYLLCDGAEISQTQYSELFAILEFTYTKPGYTFIGAGTFCIPDLRGRMALGRDNMDNRIQVSTTVGLKEYTVVSPAGVVDDPFARALGGFSGADTVTLDISNVPEHTHNLQGNRGNSYYAVRNVAGTPDDTDADPGPGGQAAGQAQYLRSSGPIAGDQDQDMPFSIMNPYLAINYIIFTGVTAQ